MDIQELRVQLRKSQSNLVNAGTGVILFTIWSAIRSFLYFTGGGDDFNTSIEEASDPTIPVNLAKIFAYSMVIIITLIDLLLRVRIARNAIAEGMDEPRMKKRRKRALSGDGTYDPTADRKNGHLALSIFLLILYVGITVFEIATIAGLTPIDSKPTYVETGLSIIVNLTSMYILMLILKSTRQVRTLTRQIYELS